jgi:hypothetical protein
VRMPDCVAFHNPGNPSCLTIGIAADCAIDPTGPGCRVDSDGDRCIDVAEAEAGFDPFDAADCVSTAGGQPAINCLFLTENLACNGDRIADPREPECTAEREIRQRRSPTTLSGCDEVDQPPTDDSSTPFAIPAAMDSPRVSRSDTAGCGCRLMGDYSLRSW